MPREAAGQVEARPAEASRRGNVAGPRRDREQGVCVCDCVCVHVRNVHCVYVLVHDALHKSPAMTQCRQTVHFESLNQ